MRERGGKALASSTSCFHFHLSFKPPHRFVQVPLQRGQKPFSGAPAVYVGITILGIPAEGVSPPWYFNNSATQDARGKVSADQPEHGPVFDLARNAAHQHTVVNPVKELFQVHLHYPPTPFGHVVPSCQYRVVGTSARAEAIAVVGEIGVEYRKEHLV